MHKFIFKLLAVQLFVLFLAVFRLINPSLSYASELIGTHLGEGDVGYQINIIKGVLIPNGLEPGSPVTVMVPVTMLLDSNQNGTVQELSNAVRSGGFFPIVRINDVCNIEAANGSVEAINTAKGIFGDDALLIWGNEVNNQETECNDWPNYYVGMNAIKDISNVSPAALDYYMGNDAYKVDTMFTANPGMSGLFDTAPRAANAYGCIGDNSSNCDPLATNTQEVGYTAINGPVYLTEFSLSPGGNAVDAPDTDLTKVLEFIENRAAETGALKVTPLVRNICNTESAWLLYINGKLFTPLGTAVDENCEGTAGGSGYTNSIYPEYGINHDETYIAPIRKVRDSESDSSLKYSVSKLREELTSQGYQAYCATENVEIKPDYDTADLISKYFDLVGREENGIPNQNVVLELEAVETLSTANSKYPLWRDVSNKQFLMTSLEEYFGFKDIYIQDPALAVMTSSPINSLLSEPQMCLQGWRNIEAQQIACEKLEDPDKCSLRDRPIPGTSYTIDTIITELEEFIPTKNTEPYPGYRAGGARIGCQALIAGDREQYTELFEGLINTPTYFDTAYRYGYIVAVIHSENPTPNENIATKIFNFFTETINISKQKPRDEVLVVAFKIPDIGTNHWEGEENGATFWDDPLSLTRKLLTTKQQSNAHEIDLRTEKKAEFLLAATENVVQNDEDKIFCTTATEDGDGKLTGGITTASCENYLTKALTDIINGSNNGCGEAEAVQVIKDVASLNTNFDGSANGRLFNTDNGVEVILNLFKGDKTHPDATGQEPDAKDPNIAKTDDPAEKLQSIFDLTTEDKWTGRSNKPATVDFYVVYPMGVELDAVEDVLSGTFFTKAQLAYLEEQQSVDGFEMSGLGIGLSSNSDSFTFEDTDKTAAGDCGTTEVIDEISGLPTGEVTKNVCNEKVSVTLKQEGAGVGILGARLGFWMKQIQKQVSSRTGDAWSYFNSCATTEEFMLGQCRGGTDGLDTGDDSEYIAATCGYNTPGTGFCSPEYLRPFFQEAGIQNPDRNAQIASRICQRESGSQPDAYNFKCIEGTSVDYSVGLFQINMLPRCPGSFEDANGVPDTDSGYNPFAKDENDLQTCTIVDQVRLNECFMDKLAINSGSAGKINEYMPSSSTQISADIDEDVIKQKADENIRAMVSIRKAWNNWDAWISSDCQR